MKTLAYMHTHIINECLISELRKIQKAQNDNLEVVLFINNADFVVKNNEIVQECEFYGLKVKCLLCSENIINTLKLPLNAFYKQNVSIGECFWFNCDYSFYIVRHYFKDFDFYWQIQYDVFYNDKDYNSFFSLYENNKCDLLITHFKKVSEDSEWCWKNHTEWIYNRSEIYGCLWCVARMSANLIDALYLKRIEHHKIYQQAQQKEKCQWLLCELFVATECIKMGFSGDKLQNDEKLGLDEIDLNNTRLFETPDKYLYHPIKGDFIKRLKAVCGEEELTKLKELEHFRGFMRFWTRKKMAMLRKNTRAIRYPIKNMFKKIILGNFWI